MYRLLEDSGEPAKTADAPARASANEAALKNPAGRACEGAVDITTGHNLLGGQ